MSRFESSCYCSEACRAAVDRGSFALSLGDKGQLRLSLSSLKRERAGLPSLGAS